MSSIKNKLKQLPDAPGVYIMKDAGGHPIYIGKAASLKKRVRSYFALGGGAPVKTSAMAEKIRDFDYIAAASEVEALILECSLIKKHRPRYNVRFRDDKKYPYIRISPGDYPGVYFTRTLRKDGSSYYGPFPNADAARRTVKILSGVFRMRTCSGALRSRARPCLYRHIGRCSAPCAGMITGEDYRKSAEGAKSFLSGGDIGLIRRLGEEMKRASGKLDFEKAGLLKQQMLALRSVREKQNMDAISGAQEDYLAYGVEDGGISAGVLKVRDGRVIGFERFSLDGGRDAAGPEIIASFIKQRYASPGICPAEIITPELPDDIELLEKWLGERRGGRVRITVPQRGRKKALLARLESNIDIRMKETGPDERQSARAAALIELARALGLPAPPRVIECFDAAHISGSHAAGAVAVFKDGFPSRADYRKFRIREADTKDDTAMMEEIVRRRVSRLLAERRALPDLIIADGGPGQLSAVAAGLASAGASVPAAALAKRFELLYLPGTPAPLRIKDHAHAFELLRHIRDEAHRTASSYHARLRGREARASALDAVPGLGSAKKTALIRRFGDVKGVAAASSGELMSVDGIGPALAQKIKGVLNAPSKDIQG